MIDSQHPIPARREVLDSRPAVNVVEAEYRRLLGYPRHHTPGERADELAAAARQWYAEHGRPWVYLREAELQVAGDSLRIDGVEFQSKQLHDYLRQAGAARVMLAAVSAGRACEERAGQLWRDGKPDEYFFLEMFGSAVVEHLVAALSGRICDLAEHDGLMAVAHYSPGYTGWDVADQPRLFELIARGMTTSFPEPFEAMSSGMLRPKKSLLAVVGLAPRAAGRPAAPNLVPCETCSFSPCQYRRAAYRFAPLRAEIGPPVAPRPESAAPVPALTPGASYSVNARALRKWAQERVRIEQRAGGAIEARFRFDGTTCSNLGRPLAFDYEVSLSAAADGYTILRADCRPAAGDDGYTQMCAYLADSDGLMEAIGGEKPLLGRPLNDVLAWSRPAAPSGCHCSADSRAHKWGLALEAIHYSLANSTTASSANPS